MDQKKCGSWGVIKIGKKIKKGKNGKQKYVKKKLRLRRKLEEDASDALGVALCHGITLTDTPDHVEPI